MIEWDRDAALAGAMTTMRLDGRRAGSPEFDLWAAAPAGITARLLSQIAACARVRLG